MYVKRNKSRIFQGDLLEDVKYTYPSLDEKLEIPSITLPYAVILTQECDLEHDFENRSDVQKPTNDKYLLSLLVCPAYIAEKFRTGDHLADIFLKMENWNTVRWNNIKSNQNERFHFLEESVEYGIPPLVIDFKHYYTMPRAELYKIYDNKYVVSITELFREDLSQRFANYLSRIGLPVTQMPQNQTGAPSI